ncbi:MAG: NADPH-dependent assimilatory sulfite reductase hemoprotein subunit [Pirellulales bacterium]|nr:NADPH-dependent assimilatory sulfite reductase hemoprotein subunit [Pirellulales bacterium]
MSAEKLTPLESIKSGSLGLRGSLAEELLGDSSHFSKDSAQLLKHHGTYQQHNRDERATSTDGKREKSFSFMVRTRIPGGRLTAEQMLAELDLCDEVGNTTLRITTRQSLQLHGVVKGNLQQTLKRINDVQLTTLAACGDVCRNVMCCPAPCESNSVHSQLQAMATRLADLFAPRTKAYHEIWLKDPSGEDDDQRVAISAEDGSVSFVQKTDKKAKHVQASTAHTQGKRTEPHALPSEVTTEDSDVDPLYGPSLLPRKFKTAIGLPDDNCVDLYANDLGLMAICEDDEIIGYNVLVGGGMGVSPSNARTFPALASKLAFVKPDDVPDVALAIVKVFRDFGCRTDRKRARLKYLIHDWGLSKFRAQVEAYLGRGLAPPRSEDVTGFDDHIGWRQQRPGVWYYGLNIENGRIVDTEKVRLKTAIREILRLLSPDVRLTAHQSIIFANIAETDRALLENILAEHGVPLSSQISNARRWSMSCPAMPTCGLAITESERALPGVITELEQDLARLGLSAERFTVRMTGCPNGCARPYNADVGLVGKAQGKYTLLLGGRLLGDRLNFVYQDMVALEEIVPTLRPVLTFFKYARRHGETFGDFCHRQGRASLLAWCADLQAATLSDNRDSAVVEPSKAPVAQGADLGIARCA